jgi:hypothetical protein
MLFDAINTSAKRMYQNRVVLSERRGVYKFKIINKLVWRLGPGHVDSVIPPHE